MSRLSIQAFLLVTLAATANAWPVRQLYRRIAKLPGKQYLVAPELFHDRNFAMATISRHENSSSAIVEVALVMSEARCSVSIPLEANAIATGVDSIRWLLDGEVLLSNYYEFEGGARRIKLVTIDMHNCEHSYPFPEFIPGTYKILSGALRLDRRSKFAVLAHGVEFCGGVDWCRLVHGSTERPSFDSLLDFDFPWEGTSVQPVAHFDGNAFVVRLRDGASRTHKIRLYRAARRWPSRAARFAELMSLPIDQSIETERLLMPDRADILTAGLNVCWASRWDARTIHCAAFDHEGRALFNKTLSYPEPLMLFAMKSVPDGLLLLTKAYECNAETCTHIYATEIVNESKHVRDNLLDLFDSSMPQADDVQRIKYRKMRIECPRPELMQAQVYECADDAVGRVYVCDDGQHLLYRYVAVRHHTSSFY